MPSIEELAAKARAKQSKKKKEEPFDVPKRPWHYFNGDDADEGPATSDAIKAPPVSTKITPPHLVASAPETVIQPVSGESKAAQTVDAGNTANLNTEHIPSKHLANADHSVIDKEVVTNQIPTNHESVSDEIGIDHQSVTDSSPITQKAIANSSVSAPKAVRKQSVTSQRAIPNQSQSNLLSIDALLNDVPKGIKLVDFVGKMQAQILAEIYRSCAANKSNISGPISSHVFMQITGSSSDAVANRISYMKKRGLIIQGKTRLGRGGWATYELPETIYKRLSIEGTDNTEYMPSKHLAKNPETPSRIDRIENNNSTLSNLKQPEKVFDFEFGDWTSISFECVPDYARDFRLEKLQADVTNQKLRITVDELQDMIDRFQVFANGLPNRPNSPYGLFMKLVRDKVLKNKDLLAGTETMYEIWAEEAKRKRVLEMEKGYIDSFVRWESTIPESQKREFVTAVAGKFGESLDLDDEKFRGYLSNYFRDHVWKASRSSAEPSP